MITAISKARFRRAEYGGGTVQLWDRGYWAPLGDGSAQRALAAGELKFTLDGTRLHGSWVLVRMRGDRFGGKRTNWLLIKHRDEYAQPGDGDAALAEDRSAASGRTMAAIAAGTGRGPKPFMLAKKSPGPAAAVWNSNRGAKAMGETAPATKLEITAESEKRACTSAIRASTALQTCRSGARRRQLGT